MIKDEIQPEDITMNIGTMPLALISTYGDEKRDGKPNACAAGYIGQIDKKHIAVALRPSRYTYKQAIANGAFGVNFLSFGDSQIDDLSKLYNSFSAELMGRIYIGFFEYVAHDSRICPHKPVIQCTQLDDLTPYINAALYLAIAADYCGSFSGRMVDKFEKIGLTAEHVKDVPLISQCAVRVACKLVDVIESPGRKGGRHDLLIGEVIEEYLPTDEKISFITASNYTYRLAKCDNILKNIADDFPRSPFIITTPDGTVHRNSRFGVVCEQGEQTIFLAYDKDDDSANIIREQKEFVINVPPYLEDNIKASLIKNRMPITETGFTPQPSKSVSAPSIEECRTNLECKLMGERNLGKTKILIAQVRRCLSDGMIDYAPDLSMDVGGKILNNEYVIGRMSAIYNFEKKEREHLETLRAGGN